MLWNSITRVFEEPNPDERERCMGYRTGTTAAPGVSPEQRHEVLGLGGRVFSVHKFRTGLGGTMRRRLGGNRAEKVADCAPRRRATASRWNGTLFRFLYCSGLDKLPQLFDVLAGRMSLVGPRTVSASQDAAYRRWLPRLLTVKPGWLGPWAVTGPQAVEEELRLALYYVRNWTIWLDLEILFRVAKQLVLPGGAKQRDTKEGED